MITFVCGVPCAGKTTFISKNFSDKTILNLFNYQENCYFLNDFLKAEENIKKDLLEKALQGTEVIVEHTLLKRKRREEQINFLRDNGYKGEIHLIFLNPPLNILEERTIARHGTKNSLSFLNNHLSILELPSNDEKFTSITIVEE